MLSSKSALPVRSKHGNNYFPVIDILKGDGKPSPFIFNHKEIKMISVVRTKLENKTNEQFIYYIGSSKIILDPAKPVILNGEIFTKETRQEGNTEHLLVNIYNGNIAFTLIVDKDFVTDIERDSIVDLPQRSKSKLIEKVVKPAIKVADKTVIPEVKKEEPVKQEVKVETPKVEEKKIVKQEESLDNIVVEDNKPRGKKAQKL
jgi:hypothetical protein